MKIGAVAKELLVTRPVDKAAGFAAERALHHARNQSMLFHPIFHAEALVDLAQGKPVSSITKKVIGFVKGRAENHIGNALLPLHAIDRLAESAAEVLDAVKLNRAAGAIEGARASVAGTIGKVYAKLGIK